MPPPTPRSGSKKPAPSSKSSKGDRFTTEAQRRGVFQDNLRPEEIITSASRQANTENSAPPRLCGEAAGPVFQPACAPTAIGSLPHTDPEAACRLVLDYLPEIPVWPQLPRRGFRESIYVQYTEGFPGITLDHAAERFWVDRARFEGEVEALYERALADRADDYGISPAGAASMPVFARALAARPAPRLLKGQLIGPVSLGLQLHDEEGRSVFYDDELAEALVQHLRLKALWQERWLRTLFPETLIFLDEPFMVSYGSAYVPLDHDQVVNSIETVFSGLSGLKGVHCCGNTDWSLLLATSTDVINFDAYNFAEAFALYAGDVRTFLRRGGVIAWGIVPNDVEQLAREDAASLERRLLGAMQLLVDKGVARDDLLAACLVTPACGLGTLPVPVAERVHALTAEIAGRMRRRLG
jgi:hypothetical protein